MGNKTSQIIDIESQEEIINKKNKTEKCPFQNT